MSWGAVAVELLLLGVLANVHLASHQRPVPVQPQRRSTLAT